MPTYWHSRKHFAYYRYAAQCVRRYAPGGGALLDVGGGVSYGARYLEAFPEFERTSVELPSKQDAETLEGVRLVHADFLEWEPDRAFDVVLCLQVLEHLDDPGPFGRKLLRCAPVAVVSVPYRWSPRECAQHVQDPVDEGKLAGWLRREPLESAIRSRRLVAVYRGDAATARGGASRPPGGRHA